MNVQPSAPRIKERDRQAVLKALRAGVVPRTGLHHIQVGRKDEVSAILKDLEHVADGGSGIRFVIGRFGTGKSFFLNLVSAIALEKGFLVARADITTDRRLHGTSGQARALFTELMKNIATKARPEGGALGPVVERWLSDMAQSCSGDDAAFESMMAERLRPLQDLVSGFDIHTVLSRYFKAFRAGDDATQQAVVRWLRAEYDTKTEARRDLGVRAIIDDATFYDYLKLNAKLARIMGYKGLVVCIDELVVLSHRLASSRARAANYEAILRILNDCLQAQVEGLQFFFAGTEECLTDKRRGLYSYEALATRLAGNPFAGDSVDLAGPVIRLKTLTVEDLYVLFTRIRDVFASGDQAKHLVPDEGLHAFIDFSRKTLGEDYFRTPRDSVMRFVGLMSVLEADPTRNWRDVLGQAATAQLEPSKSAEASGEIAPDENDLVEFKLL